MSWTSPCSEKNYLDPCVRFSTVLFPSDFIAVVLSHHAFNFSRPFYTHSITFIILVCVNSMNFEVLPNYAILFSCYFMYLRGKYSLRYKHSQSVRDLRESNSEIKHSSLYYIQENLSKICRLWLKASCSWKKYSTELDLPLCKFLMLMICFWGKRTSKDPIYLST
jgi:hypothetical protein